MSALVLGSAVVRIMAFVLSIRLARRVRAVWCVCLSVVLGLIAVRPIAVLVGEQTRWSIGEGSPAGELGALLVSGMVLSVVILIERMVAAREAAEAELRQSNARMHQIIDLVPHMIFAKDDDGRFLLANQAVADAYGTTIEKLIGKHHRDLHGRTEEVERFLEDDRDVIESGASKLIPEESFVDARGRERIRQTVKIPFTTAGSTDRAVLGVATDVTEHTRVEQELRDAHDLLEARVEERTTELKESEMRFRQLAEHIDAVFWLFDIDTEKCVYVSPAYEKIWGRPCEELYDDAYAWLKGIHPDDRERIHRDGGVDEPSRGGFDLDVRVVHTDGTVRWVRDAGFLIRDDTGRVYRLAGLAFDVTEKKQREDALKRSNEELEAFAQSISHDLKAPLRAIEGFANMLKDDYRDRLDDRACDYLSLMADGAARMDRLLNDLLQHARLGRGGVALEPVSLRSVVRDVVDDLNAEIEKKHAEIRVEGSLPELIGHRATLQTLMQNLVSNALKFVPADKTPEITIGATRGGTSYRLFVRDNGIGIESQFHDRIFSIFERLHGVEKYPGTGIGLAIVKKAAQLHDGSVTVESKPGSGSTFWITLPCHPATSAATNLVRH